MTLSDCRKVGLGRGASVQESRFSRPLLISVISLQEFRNDKLMTIPEPACSSPFTRKEISSDMEISLEKDCTHCLPQPDTRSTFLHVSTVCFHSTYDFRSMWSCDHSGCRAEYGPVILIILIWFKMSVWWSFVYPDAGDRQRHGDYS